MHYFVARADEHCLLKICVVDNNITREKIYGNYNYVKKVTVRNGNVGRRLSWVAQNIARIWAINIP